MIKHIVGYEDDYTIDTEGNIYSLKSNKQLVVYSNVQVEYLQVHLWKNNQQTTFYVHRLVAQHFIPNPKDLPEVNHIDGNRCNPEESNLEWTTHIENIEHAIRTGLRIYSNRLTKEEFINCLQDIIAGESYASLSLRVPYKVPFLSTKLRKIAKELGWENKLNTSLKEQRANRNRKVLTVINSK